MMDKKGDFGWLLWIGIILIIVLLLVIIIPLFYSDDANLEITSIPSTVNAGENFNLTVSISNGKDGNISGLVIGFSENRVSNPEDVGDYDLMTTVFCTEACEIPEMFNIQMSINESGTYYMRAFGEYKDKMYYSEEERINVVSSNQTLT